MGSFQFKIRHKFVLTFASLILFPALVLGFSTLRIVRLWVVDQVLAEQKLLLSSIKANIVDRHVEDMERALNALSGDPRLQSVFASDTARAAVVDQWELIRSVFPERSWVYYGSTDNQILVSPAWRAPREYDLRVRPWYQKAVAAGGIVWIEPYSEYISSDTMMSTANPIYDDAGNLLGVLSIDTHMRAFLNLMRGEASKHATQIAAVSQGGVLHRLNTEASDLRDLHHLPDQPHADREPFITLEGTRYLKTELQIPRLNLTLLSLLPASSIYAEVNPILNWILLITAGFVLVALGAGLYFSRHFVGNIERLNDYMSAVAGGDYSPRYCVSGSDEFHLLNARLNALVHTLAEDIRVLRTESQTDPLCNIHNRRFVLADLSNKINERGTVSEPISVCMFDVDHFKQVNDRYGHGVGDEVLLRIARLIQGALPYGATLGRYGGEEFLAVLPGVNAASAMRRSERVRAEIEAQTWREPELSVTLSGGVAELQTGETPQTLIARADRALYLAKERGRNRVVSSEPTRRAS